MNPDVLLTLLTIGFGALAGGLTNTIAVWMLFHPYHPPRLFGRWPMKFLHGAVPKNQPRLAAAIGRTVGNRLLTPDDLTNTFANPEFREAFDHRLRIVIDEVLHTERGSLGQLIPPSVRVDVEQLIDDGIRAGMEQLSLYVTSERFEESMLLRAGDLVDAIADEPIAGILTPTRGVAVQAAVEEWLHGVVESDDFSDAVSDYIERAAIGLLRPGQNFEEILPVGLVGSMERAIASYLPLAAQRLGGLLDDPETRRKFQSTIEELLQRFLRDLKFHQRVVARVVMTEDTIQKVLDTIQEEGAERLSEILRDPAVQRSIAKGANEAIVDFLRRPVNEVLGQADDPSMVATRDTLTGWVVGIARDPATREFLVEKLRDGLDHAGARTWGDVLERVPAQRIADLIVATARTEVVLRAVESGARRLAARGMEHPVGVPARWFPDDGPDRIEVALGDPIWDWVQTQVPAVVERLDVARRVEEKVLHFPTARMEEIVRKVTDRELRLIVRLGYVLGAFIGLLMVAVDALVR